MAQPLHFIPNNIPEWKLCSDHYDIVQMAWLALPDKRLLFSQLIPWSEPYCHPEM